MFALQLNSGRGKKKQENVNAVDGVLPDKLVFCIPLEFKRAAVFVLSHKQLSLFQIAANEPMRSLTNSRRKWEYYCLVDSIQHICHIELAADKKKSTSESQYSIHQKTVENVKDFSACNQSHINACKNILIIILPIFIFLK